MAGYPTEIPDRPERRPLIWALGYLLLALVAINMPIGGQQAIAAFLRGTVLRPFVWTQETLTQARITNAENASLQAQLDSMVADAISANRLVDENVRLRALLSLSERLGANWIPSSAIRSGTAGSEGIFHLDIGSDDGVEAGAPIVTRGGVVGLVLQVLSTSSVAMDWSHPDFAVSAMDFEGEIYGFVESVAGDSRERNRLHLDGTPYTEELVPGQVVVTSGRGGVYPRGVPIGTVVEVAEAEAGDAGWRRRYWIRPFVEPGSVTHVLVGLGEPDRRIDAGQAWSADSVFTEPERRSGPEMRADSLPIFRDSIDDLLREINRLRPPPDTSGSGPPAPPSDGSPS